jgi:hypothetical protein
MMGVNKCKEHNRKVDEDYEKKLECAKNNSRGFDYIYKESYDDVFEDDEYFVYWIVPGILCLTSIPMIIYGIFVIPWLIAPTGSTIDYLLGFLK